VLRRIPAGLSFRPATSGLEHDGVQVTGKVLQVFFILRVACGEARINVLRDEDVLLETSLLDAGLVRSFERAVLIQGSTDKVGTIGQVGGSRTHAQTLRRATPRQSLDRRGQPVLVIIGHRVEGGVGGTTFHCRGTDVDSGDTGFWHGDRGGPELVVRAIVVTLIRVREPSLVIRLVAIIRGKIVNGRTIVGQVFNVVVLIFFLCFLLRLFTESSNGVLLLHAVVQGDLLAVLG
jgi:hypothetical protein